ncbi:MAG: M28 family peptidase [Gammaproteobacteria bacterium]|nr:M28 family peptidase [Gammaproteobacteria bacterium]
MKKGTIVILLLGVLAIASCAEKAENRITAQGILSDVEALSADSMEGRGAGTAGAARAEAYIASRFEQIGLEPIGKSYLLPVELVGMKKDVGESSVSISGPERTPSLEDDVNFTFWSTAGQPVVDLVDVPIVFVGYGVQAPEYGWDDLKEEDVRGKVLLFLNNDPQAEEDGEALFEGPARTYYGRWPYKFEQAEKLGAAGAIVVHTTESASYQFSVIGNSGSRRVWQRSYKLDFLSWMDEPTTSILAASMGTTVPGLFEMANQHDFRPVDTGYRVTSHIETVIERFEDANVAGVVRGNDADLADEYLVFTAHHDHLGMDPNIEGDDKIFNGALDNALGVAAMIAAAEAAAAKPPRRSIIFLSTTAEEGGILGGSAFVANPPVPLHQIVANFNIDSPQSFGLTHDIGAIGLEMSSLGTLFAEVADEQEIVAVGDPNPNAGSFYRSDQVNFAKAGIPALYLQRGTDFVTPLSFSAEELRSRNYHQVTDVILPEWDLDGITRDMRVLFEVATRAANADEQPRWVAGNEFEEEWKALYGR